MEFMAFWYQVIIASEALLQECIHSLGDDGFEGELKAFYVRHLAEEKDHAKWLREDMGGYQVQFDMRAAEIAGVAYYLIRHVHPVALMGYMQALEGNQIPQDFIDHVEKTHGKKATRTLRIHADNDPDHVQELNKFPIPQKWQPLVLATKEQTQRYIQGL